MPPKVCASYSIHQHAVNPRDCLEPNITQYIHLRSLCCNPAQSVEVQEANTPKLLSTCAARIRSKSYQQVQASALAGSAEDSLEAGIRLYSGCTVAQSAEKARFFWQKLVDDTSPGAISNAPRSIRAQAFCCLAHLHDGLTVCVAEGAFKGAWNVGSMYRAASAADRGAALGLFSPIVYKIGGDVQRVGWRCNKDNVKTPQYDVTRFERLSSLWEVIDEGKEKNAARIKRREEKMMRSGGAYVCAARDCGIEATKKAALLRCSGPCTMPEKPHYCSPECQKSDWKRHKPSCKPSTDSSTTVKPSQDSAPDEAPRRPREALQQEFGPAHYNTDAMERSVYLPDLNLPGEQIRVSSSKFSPAFLRQLRDACEKEAPQSQT